MQIGHIVVDGTVIRLNDEQSLLYGAADSGMDGSHYRRLDPPGQSVIAGTFFSEFTRGTTLTMLCFSSIVQHQ